MKNVITRHKFNPTEEYLKEVLKFAQSKAPDELIITVSKSVILDIRAIRGGATLFDLGKLTLNKGDSVLIDGIVIQVEYEL